MSARTTAAAAALAAVTTASLAVGPASATVAPGSPLHATTHHRDSHRGPAGVAGGTLFGGTGP